MRREKRKNGGGGGGGEERKRKENVKHLETLLSAHARTSPANILHLDQKAANVRPVNCFVFSFSSLQPDSD